MKKTASGGALLAECFAFKSRFRSDSCLNSSSIVWPPPGLAAADEGPGKATGAVPSACTTGVRTAGGTFAAVGVTSAFADVEEGSNKATTAAPSGCTDTSGAERNEAGGAAGALPTFSAANAVGPDEVEESEAASPAGALPMFDAANGVVPDEVAPPGCTDGTGADEGFEEVGVPESI